MNICILGAGAWGTAFALHLSRLTHTVTLVPRRSEFALELASTRENADYLPGHSFDDSLQVAGEIGPSIMEADVIIFACPVKGLAEFSASVKESLGGAHQLKLLVTLCKGLDRETLKWPVEILRDALPGFQYGVLSGPTNAAEVAQGKPTAMVFGTDSEDDFVSEFHQAISNQGIRVYFSKDVSGVEFCGCMKNIYAIGAGIADGLQLGDNAKAAYMTRALSEMSRLGEVVGGQVSTFMGLSGFGDLVATCSGSWSRNRTFGQMIGEGGSIESYVSSSKTVIEGYWAAQSIKELFDKKGIEAPILNQLFEVLYKGKQPQAAILELMTRDLKSE